MTGSTPLESVDDFEVEKEPDLPWENEICHVCGCWPCECQRDGRTND